MPLIKFNLPSQDKSTQPENGKSKKTGLTLDFTKPLPPLTLKPAKDILHGTGFTKRDAESQERKSERDATHATHATQRDATPEDLPTATALHLKLPSTLTDDALQLDPSQTAALNGMLKNKYACLIGAAGTGKTTTVKSLINALIAEPEPPAIALCAYTGRAVQQIKRALPLTFHDHCDTIHGLLEYSPEIIDKIDDEGNWYSVRNFVPHRTSANKLHQQVLIVDETGMFAIDLWHKMLDAKKDSCRIYFIGDINQLPPVHGRSVLGFALQQWPTFTLDRVHRTDESAIIDGAWNILHGKTPEAVSGRVALIRLSDNSLEAFKQTIGVVQKLNEGNAFKPLHDAIIVPQNRDTLGQETFNERLCAYFNQPIRDEHGNVMNQRTMITSGGTHHAWAVGDKVMATKNDREEGITNGMVGVIESIEPNPKFQGDSIDEMAARLMNSDVTLDFSDLDDVLPILGESAIEDEDRERQSSHVVTVQFQNIDHTISFTTSGTVNTLTHAYAFTCHKAQGGEYPVVIIVCHSATYRMLCREWLYTAFTRAQAKVVLLYNPRGLSMALNRQRIKGATVAEKAECFNQLQQRSAAGDDKVIVPHLPPPERL